METKTYTFKRKKGIDDLKNIYAFVGNSQGDDSKSNEIRDYISAKGWMSFIFGNEIDKTNQEAIYEESQRRILWNTAYVDQLLREGGFGEEYEISIELVHNPIFDDPQLFPSDTPLESFKIQFINLKKDNDSST